MGLNFNFNPENFGLGFLAGAASTFIFYQIRGTLRSVRETIGEQAASAQSAATQTADRRYVNDLVKWCETSHLAGRRIQLSKIVVEPRFIPAPPLAEIPDEETPGSVFDVVPKVHDFPFLHAAYHIETLSIEDLGKGDRAIALLGMPGSGRTTALQTIALWSLGKLQFENGSDAVQERLAREEAGLSNEERAKGIKDRIFMEQQARERLTEETGAQFSGQQDSLPLFQRLVPIYVHLADVPVKSSDFGQVIDPAEPLVRALQFRASRINAKTLPRHIYELLNKQQALLLIDGYDELPPAEQAEKLVWLEALMDTYSRNTFVVTGPVNGYGGLTKIGLVPLYLRPWHDLEVARAAEKWAANWGEISGKRRAAASIPAMQSARQQGRFLSPFELTLKMWAEYGDEAASEQGVGDWFGHYFTQMMNQLPLEWVSRLAVLQLDESSIGPGSWLRLEQGIRAPTDEDTVDEFFQEMEGADEDPDAKPSRGRKKTGGGFSREEGKQLAALLRSGLLIPYRDGHFRFRHTMLAAYLASSSLSALSVEQAAVKFRQPAWTSAFAFANVHGSLDALAERQMQNSADLLQIPLLDLSRWLAYAGPKAEWRKAVLGQLGNAFAARSQYPLLRERIAAALVGTRDKGAVIIFQKALRSSHPDVRRLACLGLGALRVEDALEDINALLQDRDSMVQTAAGMALGAVGSNEALEQMAAALMQSNSERLQQAIAETFAALPEEGFPVLYEGVSDQSIEVRRACLFGLKRVKTSWALAAIYRVFLNDEQWYVRSAAQQVFQELNDYGRSALRGYPQVESVPWLMSWATGLGDARPKDANGQQLLSVALEGGEPVARLLAAMTMGQLGLLDAIRQLYRALYDQEEAVRDAAYRALAELQEKMGRALPAPV